MKIAILNYADVRNFGDVLFPLLLTRELQARLPQAEIDYITPTGSSFADMQSRRLDKVDLRQYGAALLGGGEIVHRLDQMLLDIYSRFGLESIDKPTDLVFGWTGSAVAFKAWIALGSPAPYSADASADIAKAVRKLDLVGARGSQTAERLRGGGSHAVHLSPDLGWLFPRLIQDRRPAPPAIGVPYIVIQALWLSDAAKTAADLRRISESTGLAIVLLPLCRCWADQAVLSELQRASNDAFLLVDDATPDLEKLAILAGASFYVGQSMHGFIAAMAHGRPAGICMPDADDKFDELLSDLGMKQLRVPGWDQLDTLLEQVRALPPDHLRMKVAAIESELDLLLDDICDRMVRAVSSHNRAGAPAWLWPPLLSLYRRLSYRRG